jgi:hypothetical protein
MYPDEAVSVKTSALDRTDRPEIAASPNFRIARDSLQCVSQSCRGGNSGQNFPNARGYCLGQDGSRQKALLVPRHCRHEFSGSPLYLAFAQRLFYGRQRPDVTPRIAHPGIAITEKHVGGWKQRRPA